MNIINLKFVQKIKKTEQEFVFQYKQEIYHSIDRI